LELAFAHAMIEKMVSRPFMKCIVSQPKPLWMKQEPVDVELPLEKPWQNATEKFAIKNAYKSSFIKSV
jgi:hypothetical protein